ncbi:Mitochondrial ATP synthase subunit delta [Paragonimus heterotremus]|uniref:F-ATPase delta subunit n=1 Tax=Paragonimus heterotremus TaxID=100268 RepID=A0A8J4WDS2_9TREM|nr:Mitochondrial ATP synthase subunit delta [Paragonimus heterotremus]
MKLLNPRPLLNSFRYLKTSAKYNADLTLTFASADQVFYNKKVVRQVDVPTLTGRFGVLAEHVPTIGCLAPGLVSVTENDGSSKSYFVSSGIVTVNADSSMQVLAQEAATLDQLDIHAIKEGLTRSQAELKAAQNEVARVEAQIAVDAYEELAHATGNRQ